MGSITQYSITTATTSIRLGDGSRCVIQVTGSNDVRLAYQQAFLDSTEHINIATGTTLVFDPNPLNGNVSYELGDIFWVKCATGTATVTVWSQGRN